LGVIELGLFAPYNEVVQVIGNWNNWQPIELTRGPDGWWRTTVELEDGDYQYKFRVKSLSYFARGQMLDLFDPYALSITEDAGEATILRVRDGRRIDVEYDWKHDDESLPNNRDLVIYEIHVGDFAGKQRGGKFKHVIEKLDYLKELGINCLELMPVKEFPGRGWGYSLRSLFGVENSYGKPEDLCRLIDEAHGRGMRVVIDGVYNHSDAESPLTKIDYTYWYYGENPDPPEFHWGPKFDYGHWDDKLKIFPARKYVIESIQFWVQVFHIDGIRFDATGAIKNFDVLRELANSAFDKIGGIKPFITIAEHIPEDPAVTGRPDRGPMNAAWHDNYAWLLQTILTGKERGGHSPWNLDELEMRMNPATNGYIEADRFVNYLSSHDHHRAMQILGEEGKIFDEAAFRKMKLGLGLLLMSPGLPMIWMGNEFGFAADKSLDPRPLDWDLLNNESNAGLVNHTKAMAKIRHDNAALRTDSFETVLKDQKRLLFGFKRWNGGGNQIVIVANLKDEPSGEFVIENVALEDGEWHEAVFRYDTKVEGGVLRDSLGPSELKVFIRKS
jgi:1,4-alpha-glucan branching enzyme